MKQTRVQNQEVKDLTAGGVRGIADLVKEARGDGLFPSGKMYTHPTYCQDLSVWLPRDWCGL